MQVIASLRHLRMAPRKIRLVIDTVRGLSVNEAESRLKFVHKAAGRPVLKLLQSAIANAEHNFKLDRSTLFVKTITADGGPTLKRMRPRAMGRGATIRKRTTHINLILDDRASSALAVAKAEVKAARIEKPAKTVVKKAPKAKKATA